MYAAMLAAEAARTAQEIHGVGDITPEMMRDGMEALEMTNARMEELGVPMIGPEFAVSCEDHGGTGMAIMTQWNGTEWVTLTDFVAPDDSVTQPLVMEDSAQYAAENNISSQCGES
jgi:branched-chain amino acid transport system substrate-binding protein